MPGLRTVVATRYVTPLREGGSLPAVVEGDDDGLYVLKFRGAGHGARALVAELVAGELARAAGLPVPEIVFMQLDPELARTEPDPEIQDLIRASAGLNLALDYLPGAMAFDPLAGGVAPGLASRTLWFDAFTTNVDRTPRNPNLLRWHGALWLIDHGAALYFHHHWDDSLDSATSPFAAVAQHVLLPWASELEAADAAMPGALTPEVIRAVVAQVPDAWLADSGAWAEPATQRSAHVAWFERRLRAPRAFVEEAQRARSLHL